jgi:hypothetical protein
MTRALDRNVELKEEAGRKIEPPLSLSGSLFGWLRDLCEGGESYDVSTMAGRGRRFVIPVPTTVEKRRIM